MASRKVQTVSISKLVASVDKAVALASRTQGIRLQGGTIINRWEIVGRVLRERIHMDEAFELAKQVTQTAKLQGMKVDPIASQIGGDILVGFVARGAIPALIR